MLSRRILLPSAYAKARDCPLPLRKIILDMDDVLWDSQRAFLTWAGIPYEKHIEFQTEKSPLLTPDERQKLLQAYSHLDCIKDLPFYPKLELFKELADYGGVIYVKSNSFTQEIADYKLIRLTEALPWLPAQRIELRIINQKTALGKSYDEDIFAAVDDSPYNIVTSPARYNIMLIHPWNQSSKAKQMVVGKNVFYTPTGDIEAICNLLQSLLIDNAA